MIKFIGLVLSVSLFIPKLSTAQDIENAIFWEISGNGLSQPSYLFGTIHFLPKEDFFITENMKEKMATCELFSTETLYDHHTTHELNKAAHLPHHESLADHMSEEDFEKVRNFFLEELGVKKLRFQLVYSRLKPMVLLTSITLIKIGADAKFFETELLALAQNNGMEFLGLETVEREIEALNKFPLEAQTTALLRAVNNFDKHMEDYRLLIDYYKEDQNLEKILYEALEPSIQNTKFRDAFYNERNLEWIPVMERKMNLAPTFFAVGAAHLVGEVGLIQLLRDAGYELKPLEVF